jgi:hypothetical protein
MATTDESLIIGKVVTLRPGQVMDNDENDVTGQSDSAKPLDDADKTPNIDPAVLSAREPVNLRCGYAVERVVQLPVLGGVGEALGHVNCRIKMRSERNRLAIHTVLFAKGLEGGIVGNNCPVGPSGNWQACPYYEPGR